MILSEVVVVQRTWCANLVDLVAYCSLRSSSYTDMHDGLILITISVDIQCVL